MSVSGHKSPKSNASKYGRWLIVAVVGTTGLIAWQRLKPGKPVPAQAEITRRVTAIGRLTPEGGIVTLSVPAGASTGGSDVVQQWFVGEGDSIQKGQLLAQMNSFGQLKEDLNQANANLKAAKVLLPYLKIGNSRGAELFKEGAITEQELGKAVTTLQSRQATIEAAQAAFRKAQLQVNAAQIRSPLDGSLIQIYSQPGMKETNDGLAIIGRTDAMEVWAQVFQADVNQLQKGQDASIRAESGGFSGTLTGKVKAIIGNVSSRNLFATANNVDVNARVVLVKLSLQPQDIKKVSRLSGLNVIVTFK
jgi:HlyD family secretion protein